MFFLFIKNVLEDYDVIVVTVGSGGKASLRNCYLAIIT